MAAAGRRGFVCALSTVGLLFAVPAGAEIRTVELAGGTLEIKAGDSADVIKVAAGQKSVSVHDRDGIAVVPSGCSGTDDLPMSTIRCPRTQVDQVVVDLGDGNDEFDGDGDVRFEIVGDKGNDEMDGGDAGDLIEGRFGDDTIDGSEGSDEILGGLDDDTMFGRAGKDLLDGGPGKDRGDAGEGKDECAGVEKEKKDTCEHSQKG